MSLFPGKLARDLRTGKCHTPYKSGRGSGVQTRKVQMGKCSYVCIYMMCTKDPRKRTNGGCSSHSWGQSLFKLLMDLLIQYGVSLRTHLHFLGSMQNEPQVIKFSLSPWGSCKWPALAIIQFGHLVSHQADGLCHQAVSRDSEVPSFLACHQRKSTFHQYTSTGPKCFQILQM